MAVTCQWWKRAWTISTPQLSNMNETVKRLFSLNICECGVFINSSVFSSGESQPEPGLCLEKASQSQGYVWFGMEIFLYVWFGMEKIL